MKIKIRVTKPFFDMYDLSTKHLPGEILETESETRATAIGNNNLGDLISIEGDYSHNGKKVIVYVSRIFKFGGIETACLNMAKAFKDKNITFLFGASNMEQALRVARFRPVVIDSNTEMECDVLIVMGYDGMRNLKAKIKARKTYQQIHADWSEMKKLPGYKSFELDTNGIDRFLSVSDTAQRGLLRAFKEPIDSVVVPNILVPEKYGEFRIFLTLSRLEAEKGGNILLNMFNRFKTANKRFLWVICGGGSEQGKITTQLCDEPNVILLPPSLENKWLLPKVDYLVQTSLSESYCYSIHEALAVGTPVISTNIPEARKVIKDGENGYLVDFGLNNLDIEAIFNNRPQFEPKQEKVEPVWNKVLKGEL